MQFLLRYKYFIIAYLGILFLRLIIGPLYQEVNLLFGGAIAASLLVLYILKVEKQNGNYILAMILAMVGDISLAFMRQSSLDVSYIAYGLSTLLLVMVFQRARRLMIDSGALFLTALILLTVIYVAVSSSHFLGLAWTLPSAILAYFALNMKLGRNNLLTTGALFYVISSVLCFVGEVYQLPLLLPHILSYGLGHLLICLGLVESYQRAVARQEAQVPKWRKKSPKKK